MVKRTTKITSLIVTAASIASMVPAMAADYKKVESNDGIIYNAIAYKDGKFYIDGEIEDSSEEAYYLSDGKYTELDDIDSGDSVNTYGEKYVEVGSGDYYLDLETGKVTDDELAEDDLDDAKTALKKKIKKDNDGRYSENEESDLNDSIKTIYDENDYMDYRTPFIETYYEAQCEADEENIEPEVNGGATHFTVYTDKDGNYIDADYNLGKVNVVVDGKTYNIKNTNDDDGDVRGAIRHIQTIGQDKDYIYRIALLTINANDATFGSKSKNFEATTTDGVSITTGESVSFTEKTIVPVIQKISKAQDSDDVDGAKFAKTVNTYMITNDDGETQDLLGLQGNGGFTIADGKIISYEINDDNIKAETITLKSKNGYYYTDISDSDDTDIEEENNIKAISVDIDGNLWALEGGNIKKWDNDESWDKVYKVDGSCTQLSVYDKDNIVAWSEDDEVYSIIAGEAATEEESTTEGTTVTTTGWVQDTTTGTWSYVKADGTKAIGWLQSPASGLWYYMDATGTMMVNGWVQDAGKWYFLDATGAMKTGWVYTGGAWYYLASNGSMQTGWIQTGGKWYYCNASGAMLANTTVDGYVLGADGAWIK